MTKASVEFSFKGGFEGKAQTEFVMYYREYDQSDPHKASATYVGLTKYTGSLNGKTGSFVTEDRGTFAAGTASSVSTILPGSGTGDLKGISGKARAVATHSSSEFELEYSL
jgi:hypothetical protein